MRLNWTMLSRWRPSNRLCLTEHQSGLPKSPSRVRKQGQLLLLWYLSVIYIFKEWLYKCRFLIELLTICTVPALEYIFYLFFYWLWVNLTRVCVFMCVFQWWALRACRLKTELVPVIRMWPFRLARLRREPKLSTVTSTLCGRRRSTCESYTIFSVLLESCLLSAVFLFSFLFNVIRKLLLGCCNMSSPFSPKVFLGEVKIETRV